MQELRFTIPGKPFAQKRHRDASCTSNGTTKRWKYDPSSKDKEIIRLAVCDKLPHGLPVSGPVLLDWIAVFPLPSSISKKQKEYLSGRMHTKKPDRDNIDKILMDALNGVVWEDDSQVCAGKIQKVWATPNSEPRLEVTIKFEEN